MCWQTAFRKGKNPAVWKEVVDQGKLQLVKGIRGRGNNNNKALNQPPSRLVLWKAGFPAVKYREPAGKSFSQPEDMLCAAGHPADFEGSISQQRGFVPVFFQNWRKQPHPDKIN